MKQCNRKTWDDFIDKVDEVVKSAYAIRVQTDDPGPFNAFQEKLSECVKDFHDGVFGIEDEGRRE